jgi:subtilisin family serine protease
MDAPPDSPLLPPVADLLAAIQSGRGEGIRVAVLDSGLNAGHPRLQGLRLLEHVRIEPQGDLPQEITVPPSDPLGHGTAVVDLIHRGAPEAEFGIFQILHQGGSTTARAVAVAAHAAITRGYHIIHCSLGSPARREETLIHKDWIDAAYLGGTHVVAAGSNSGFARPEWPAWFPTVIATGACPDNNEALRLQQGSLVEFLIGGRARAAWLGQETAEVVGSSFAAPKVTALLARLLSTAPGLDPLFAKSLLKHLARHPNTHCFDL